ncbi:MAG: hypothetical protein JXB14_04655 [Candidatus Altiarchaeota archaeon]|nr:hypothetical protein [Candidatus Altiarchaeota archaeon]
MKYGRTRHIAAIILLMVFLVMAVDAATCPFTKSYPQDYTSITLSPIEKYVGERITIRITDVAKDGSKYPAANRFVVIYFVRDNEISSEYNDYTDEDGVVVFVPEDSGDYTLVTSGRNIRFYVESRCGDGRCNANEDRANCPQDCARCGDSVCDVNEDKRSCPKDCIICGDDSCDSGENRVNCPDDCARCGDGICDKNENKESCPEDCVVCGDGVCDILELVSLHDTTCPQDCVQCGDGYCDYPEDFMTCPGDCITCGDRICSFGENISCPRDCEICGNGVCESSENKSSCMEDCAVCGDGECDSNELISLHESDCPEDCNDCGDGYCDHGEPETCRRDCEGSSQGVFREFFIILLILAAVVVMVEIAHYHLMGKRAPGKTVGGIEKKPQKPEATPRINVPYMLLLSLMLLVSVWLLSVIEPDYGVLLNIFELGNYLMNNAVVLFLLVLVLSTALSLLAYMNLDMDKRKAITVSVPFVLIGVVPGFLFFQSIEFVIFIISFLAGVALAIFTVKSEEKELKVRKPFKIGNDAAGRVLIVVSMLLSLMVFMQLYLKEDTADSLASTLWNSPTSKALILENMKGVYGEGDVKAYVVEPFFDLDIGGGKGRLFFAGGVSLLLLALLKVFSVIVKLLTGAMMWAIDRLGAF